jgi:hypothetical protein
MSTAALDRLDGSALQPVVSVGDVGTALLLRLFDLGSDAYDPLNDPTPPVLDISASGARVMRFSKPADTPGDAPIIVDKAGTFATVTGLPGYVGDGSDGYVQYITEADFLDRAGRWRRQAIVTIGASVFRSEIVDFDVSAAL